MNSKMKKAAATVCLGVAVLTLTPALFLQPRYYIFAMNFAIASREIICISRKILFDVLLGNQVK